VKKVFCVFLAVILCFGTLSACTKPNTKNNTTTAAATTEATDENNSGLISNEQAKLTAAKFLNYMKKKDVKNILAFIDSYAIYDTAKEKQKKIAAYSFFRNIDLKSYKILEIQPYESYYRITVKLNISKSGSELFPAGTSTWVLDVANYDKIDDIQLFKNANKTINVSSNEGQGAPVDFCINFSEMFNSFGTYTDFNKLVPNIENKDAFNTFCYNVIAFTNTLDGGPIPRKQIAANAKKILGITTVDFKKYRDYNKKNDTILAGGSDFSSTFCSLSSEKFDSYTKQDTIQIDYYADTAYILKAKTMKYVVRENADGSLTLLSTALLFDSGVNLAYISML